MFKRLLRLQRVDQGSAARTEESAQHTTPAERLGSVDQSRHLVLQANKPVSSLPVERLLCTRCDNRPRIDGHDFCSFYCFIQHNEQHNPDFWSQIEVKSGKDLLPSDEIGAELDPLNNQLILGSKSQCLLCHKKAATNFQDFCSKACHQAAIAKAPLLLPVPENHEAFQKVVASFKKGRPKASSVYYVYKIVCTPNVTQAYQDYCDMLNSRRKHPGANVQKLWSWDSPCRTWQESWKPGKELAFCGQSLCSTCRRVQHGQYPGEISVPRTQAFAGHAMGGYFVDILCDTALGRCRQGNGAPDYPLLPFDSVRRASYDWFTLKSVGQGLNPLYLVLFKLS